MTERSSPPSARSPSSARSFPRLRPIPFLLLALCAFSSLVLLPWMFHLFRSASTSRIFRFEISAESSAIQESTATKASPRQPPSAQSLTSSLPNAWDPLTRFMRTQPADGRVSSGGSGTGRIPDSSMFQGSQKSYKFAFELPENPGTKEYADMDWCAGSLEPESFEVYELGRGVKALFAIGAQEAGTDIIAEAMKRHPSAVCGTNPSQGNTSMPVEECGPMHFFDRWPMYHMAHFRKLWPEDDIAEMDAGSSKKFLFDATPEYMRNAVTPPRIKGFLPQAKIVIVLRDPVEMSWAAWSDHMAAGALCGDSIDASATCVLSSFKKTFERHMESFENPECLFTTQKAKLTYGDCFRCTYTHFSHSECMRLPALNQELFPCVRRQFDPLDAALVAPQIAWWLEFFPPEQLFITTTDQLLDPATRTDVLNGILDFAGARGAATFSKAETADAAEAAPASDRYAAAAAAAADIVDVRGRERARNRNQRHYRDLEMLLERFFPGVQLPRPEWNDAARIAAEDSR